MTIDDIWNLLSLNPSTFNQKSNQMISANAVYSSVLVFPAKSFAIGHSYWSDYLCLLRLLMFCILRWNKNNRFASIRNECSFDEWIMVCKGWRIHKCVSKCVRYWVYCWIVSLSWGYIVFWHSPFHSLSAPLSLPRMPSMSFSRFLANSLSTLNYTHCAWAQCQIRMEWL